MATSNVAVRRYAKALFEIAQEEGRVDAIRAELRGLGALLESNDELSGVLLEPLHPAAQRRAVLKSVLDRLGASAVLRNFYSFLIDQRRLFDVARIENEFGRLADEAAGLIVAKVRIASALSREQRGRLQRALTARTGRNVTLQIEIDPELLGGLVAQVSDTVFDGSLRTQLTQLRTGLSK